MTLELWLTFVAASVALLLIPGPTVLMVLSYALSKGPKVAVASAAGVALGDFAAMSASLAGLGALVMASASLFMVLKWVGAIYLIWLGVKLFRSAPTTGLSLPADADVTGRQVFGHMVAVTALNPKSITFFIAFVPQFIVPDAPLMAQFVLLTVTFVILATLNALGYALLASRFRRVISRPVWMTWITRSGGGALVAMGLLTASLRRGVAG